VLQVHVGAACRPGQKSRDNFRPCVDTCAAALPVEESGVIGGDSTVCVVVWLLLCAESSNCVL
jgi:hypothetical protein